MINYRKTKFHCFASIWCNFHYLSQRYEDECASEINDLFAQDIYLASIKGQIINVLLQLIFINMHTGHGLWNTSHASHC